MERHPEAGVELLEDVEFPWDVLPMVRSHHERWDGRGYPDRLTGEAIPLHARILALADVFDALTTRRPYKEPMPIEMARNYLVENMGRQFDPACVEAFLSRWDEVLDIAAGERATPFHKAEAPLAPIIGSPEAVTAV